jgi:antitoxin (DNA-binding transcriptional repressor) of toxin-antitoxin stability system
MAMFSAWEARDKISELIRRAHAGEQIYIEKKGEIIAQLRPGMDTPRSKKP